MYLKGTVLENVVYQEGKNFIIQRPTMIETEDPGLTALIESFFKGAKELIHKGEEVTPQIWFYGKEHGAPVILPVIGIEEFFRSKEAKRYLRGFVATLWNKIALDKKFVQLVAVVMLSDAWVEVHELEKGLEILRRGKYVPLSEKPGMAEALLVQVSMSDKEIGYQWPYVRGRAEKEVVFASEPIVGEHYKDGPRALLMGLWPL